MRCGFYQTDITPPLGSVIPGDFGARYNTMILDPLYARAVIYESDGKTVGIVTVDACGIYKDITDRIRERTAQFIPLDPGALMVTATHCHGGGPTLNWGEEVCRDENYLSFLVTRAADAVVGAYQRLRGCTLRYGESELRGFSFIRIYRMKDGSFKTNPGIGNPDIDAPVSQIDPGVRVLAAFDGERPYGALVNFTCHPAIVADTRTSADYIGAMSRRLRELYGEDFIAVFLNGACGNINHVNPFDPSSIRKGIHIALGTALAERVYTAVSASSEVDGVVRCAEKTIPGRLRKPSAAYLLEKKALFDALGDGLEASKPGTPGYIETFFAWQAFGQQRDKRTVLPLYLQMAEVAGVKVFGFPCQIFVEFGDACRENAGGHAMVSAFANDYCGYVPTAECMRPGVYEARLAETSRLVPETGDELVAAMRELM
ncbi:MAG: hypothetical protein GX929_09395 [Clostridiales bacterium]|jgi:neutral ceramidase|nr:hypothetical protein [Clostridiales bacterium]